MPLGARVAWGPVLRSGVDLPAEVLTLKALMRRGSAFRLFLLVLAMINGVEAVEKKMFGTVELEEILLARMAAEAVF